jgi:branched-chain amino acid transport system permease protein
VLPALTSEYILHLGNTLMMYGVLALGLDILIGLSGQFAFAHAAFFGLGCYTTALLQLRLGVPFLVGMPAGALLAGVVGFMVAFPATRMRALYLSLATFAFAEAVRWVLASWDSVTGGADGVRISPSEIFGYRIVTEADAFPVTAIILALIIGATAYLARSRLGGEMLAVRESEHVALASGIHVNRVKLSAFVISAVFAGIAGGLFALDNSFVNPDQFSFSTAIATLSMIVVGGFGSIPGVLAGVVVIGLLPDILRSVLKGIQVWQELIYGMILMGTMMVMPLGLAGAARSLMAWLRRRLRAPAAATVGVGGERARP